MLAQGGERGGFHVTIYRSLMKDVLGGNGRQAEICQGSLEVDAFK